MPYYRHRYYSTSLGRWLSRDPIGEGGGENTYRFVKNAPGFAHAYRRHTNNGTVSGDGADSVGPFVIHGTYNSATGSARWIKTYTGSHDVH